MEVNINNEWTLQFPDGFHVMDEEERRGLNFIEKGPGECLKDPDRHIIVSISWKKAGLFTALADPADAIKAMETKVSKTMQPYGYKPDGFSERSSGGRSFSGFRYTYSVQGTGMTGESCIGKNGKVFYYLHCYYRTAMPESSDVWKGILDSAKWL